MLISGILLINNMILSQNLNFRSQYKKQLPDFYYIQPTILALSLCGASCNINSWQIENNNNNLYIINGSQEYLS